MKIYFGGHSTISVIDEEDAIFIDPVFSKRIKVLRRKTNVTIPYHIVTSTKLLLISHTHYDHLDIPTLKCFPSEVFVVCPWGTGRILSKVGFKNIVEMRWYEELAVDGKKVVFLPAIHWSFRFTNWRGGWGSFVFTKGRRTFYYAGDSAYGDHFKKVGSEFKIDVAFIPIGAYKPSFIMRRYHMNPQEALKAFKDLRASYMIPIHWGAYRIAMEGVNEPVECLGKVIRSNSLNSVVVLKPGEMWTLPEV